jgi:hypothetical protein
MTGGNFYFRLAVEYDTDADIWTGKKFQLQCAERLPKLKIGNSAFTSIECQLFVRPAVQ